MRPILAAALPKVLAGCAFMALMTVFIRHLSEKSSVNQRIFSTKILDQASSFVAPSDELENITSPYLSLQSHTHHDLQSQFSWLEQKRLLVYSAHLDPRDHRVLIVGFQHRFKPLGIDILCNFDNGVTSEMIEAYNHSARQPREGLLYNSIMWACPYRRADPPHAVTLQSAETSVSLRISNYQEQGTIKNKQLLVCVKPMVHNYTDSYQLKEFIEMNRILGAHKVALYLYEVSPKLKPLLDSYRAQGIVDLHNWKPPVPMEALHAFGQKSHNQHCLYTYRDRYEYATFIDLDELIVPRPGIKTYYDMILEARKANPKSAGGKIAGFNIHSRMCPITMPDDPNAGKSLCQAVSLRKTRCSDPPMPIGTWSKPLVDMEAVDVVDIHTVVAVRPGYRAIDLDPSIGTVHHYRDHPQDSVLYRQIRDRGITDTSLWKYKTRITEVLGDDFCSHKNDTLIK